MGNSLLRTETITYAGVQLTVQCETLLTQLRVSDLQKRLAEVVTLGGDYLWAYMRVVTQTQCIEGLPFVLPAFSADIQEHILAFEQFLNLPGEFMVAWNDAIIRVTTPPSSESPAEATGAKKDPKGAEPKPSD